MSARRLVLIAALFFIDVRVRAENKHEEEPCWGKEIPCAIQSVDHKQEFKAGDDFTLVLAANSLAQQRDGKNVQLVSGDFYIEIAKPLVFKTPYASFTCEGECKALVRRKAEEVSWKSLGGDWKVKRLGDGKEYTLSGGLQVTIGEVETNGLARMELPQSLPWAPTVLEWSKIYPGTVDLFKSDVTHFREVWRAGVDAAAAMQEQLAARAVASYEDALAKERARQKSIENEEAQLRRLFRQKNHIDP